MRARLGLIIVVVVQGSICGVLCAEEQSRTIADIHVASMDIAVDEPYLAIGNTSGTATVVNYGTGKTVRTVPHKGTVAAICISADGKVLGTGGEDGVLRLWRVSDGETLGDIRFRNSIWSASISADGTKVAIGTVDDIFLCDVPTRAIDWQRRLSGFVNAGISPDGQLIAGGGSQGVLKIWRSSDATELSSTQLFRSNVGDLRFSRSGRKLGVCAALTSEIKVIDADGNVRRSFHSDDRQLRGRRVAISDDETHVALGTYSISKQQPSQSTGKALIWRLSDGRQIADKAVDPIQVSGVGFDKTGKQLLVGANRVTGIPLK